MGESDFFKQLDARGKRRYDEKLEILGLCSDPYATTSEDWESDLIIGLTWSSQTFLIFNRFS